MTIPIYLPYYVLIGSVAIIAAILFGLRNALANSGWSEQDRALASLVVRCRSHRMVPVGHRPWISGRLPSGP